MRAEQLTSAVVIGGSAGSIDALNEILPPLPDGYGRAVLVVVHLGRRDDSLLPQLFASKCRLITKEAEDKEPVSAGTIYFAPPDYHLLVERNGRLSLSSAEPVQFSRPSIDVMFETAAEAFGERLIGVVLSGASRDGARGLAAVAEAGGETFVQQVASAEHAVMPQAALEATPGARELALADIAAYLRAHG